MLLNKAKTLFAGRFFQNLGWLGLAQVVMRISRLGTTVVLARIFSLHDYGLVSIIYTCQNFSEVFTMGTLGGGMSAKIIQADPDELDVVCDTSYWITWIVCVCAWILQSLLAFPIAWFYDDTELILPVIALSFMYLTYPMFKIHNGLIQRENRLKLVAIGRTGREIVSNLVTISLAFLGWGVWSVVWGLVLSAPVWIFVNYYNHDWRPPKKITFTKWKSVLSFGISMMGIEFMDKLRLNLDYLIVGRFLGVNALGLYFFAFNAGLGISKQIVNSIMLALFPQLCEASGNKTLLKKKYLGGLKTIGFLVVPLVLLQSSLAPFYVPIVFGKQWTPAIPILITICLSAIPLAFGLASYQLLNATGQINLTLKWNLIYTALFAISIGLAVAKGVYWVAIAVLICQGFNIFFSVWASRRVFSGT